MKTILKLAAVAVLVVMVGVVPSMAQSNDSEYVIVANKEIKGNVIKADSFKMIYQRDARTMNADGSEIIPVDLYTAEGFYQNLFGKSYVEMQMQWTKQRNSYNVDLPVSQNDPEEVKNFIAANKDAIGFLKVSDVDERVKVIKLVN